MSHKRVKVGRTYRYQPVGLDLWERRTTLEPGDLVTVVNLPGCPKANTMGHCHVQRRADGKFAGLVLCNSLADLSDAYFLNVTPDGGAAEE